MISISMDKNISADIGVMMLIPLVIVSKGERGERRGRCLGFGR